MKKRYVNFETAKLLKEKGFDEKCRFVWILDKANNIQDTNGTYQEIAEHFIEGHSVIDNSDIISMFNRNGWSECSKEIFLCPTYQTAKRWLNENYHLNI